MANQDKEKRSVMERKAKVVPMTANNIADRLKLCWGHLDDWEKMEITQKSRRWLEKTNSLFSPTTFIAYLDEVPIGFIEFLPQKLMRKLKLCPCRVDIKNRETEDRYILDKENEDFLFISCLFVAKNHQGKGVGKLLLNYLINSNVFSRFDSVSAYARERDESWDKHIHWPAGSKEFYLKAGFQIEKTLEAPKSCLLSYRSVEAHR